MLAGHFAQVSKTAAKPAVARKAKERVTVAHILFYQQRIYNFLILNSRSWSWFEVDSFKEARMICNSS